MTVSFRAKLRLFLRARLFPSEVDAEIQEELRYHLEMRARDYEAGGVSRSRARRLARERFGDVSRVRYECRRLAMLEPTRKGDPHMASILRDIAYAVRSLSKAPGFTLVVLVTLALGIGANTAIFSVIEGVLLRPLPFDAPEELVRVWENDRLRGTSQEGFSGPDFFDVAERNEVFESIAAMEFVPQTLTGKDREPRRVLVSLVTEQFLSVLRVSPRLGRSFVSHDHAPDADRVVLLSHRFWMGELGGDPSIVGRRITLEGASCEVAGIMPPDFQFPNRDVDLWMASRMTPTSRPRGNHSFSVVARLRQDTTVVEATANVQAIAGALEEEYPIENLGRGMWAESVYDASVGSVRDSLFLLLGAVLVVLLVACVNVGNLSFARALAREQETAIRAAMGAGRTALIRQCLSESLVLSLAGGLLGILVAHRGLGALLALVPSGLPRVENIGVNGTVLLFALGASLATGVLFGLVPAIRSSRPRLVDSLKEASRGGGSGRHALRRTLVMAQIATAVALVIGAGLLIHSFWKLTRVDPGFVATNVVSADLQLPASRYPQEFGKFPQWTEVRAFQNELVERVEALPGVQSAAIAINTPADAGWTSRFVIEGRPPVAPGEQDEVRVRVVSPRYFRTVGIPVLRGRDLDERDDRADAPAVVLVNEAFARRYFLDDDPLGARITQWDLTREIVGIVKDVKFRGLARETQPAIYPTFSQAPFAEFSLLVRTREAPEQAFAMIRDVVASMDPDLALSRLTTMNELLANSVAQPRFTMTLFAFFAAVALGLAAIGIYGVMSFSVRERTHEIGVRLSLGASRRDVLRLVVGDGVRLAAVGVGVGLLLAGVGTRAMETLLFGVTRLDPATFVIVSLLAAIVGLAASYVPAMRAARVDPMRTLRHE